MNSPTRSGSYSLRSYRGPPRDARACRTGRSSTGWPTRSGPESPGVTCQNATDRGRRSTPASAAMPWTTCSPGHSSRSRPTRTPPATSTGSSRSTSPSSAPTSTPPPPAEKGDPSAGRTGRSHLRPIPRRPDHQNHPRLRRPRPAPRHPADTRPTPRQQSAHAPSWNASVSRAPARADPAAGPTRSSPTRPPAKTRHRTPSRKRPTRSVTATTEAATKAATEAGYRHSTGRSTVGATSWNAASTDSRASANRHQIRQDRYLIRSSGQSRIIPTLCKIRLKTDPRRAVSSVQLPGRAAGTACKPPPRTPSVPSGRFLYGQVPPAPRSALGPRSKEPRGTLIGRRHSVNHHCGVGQDDTEAAPSYSLRPASVPNSAPSRTQRPPAAMFPAVRQVIRAGQGSSNSRCQPRS